MKRTSYQIDYLHLTQRARNGLLLNNLFTLREVEMTTHAELMAMRGIGKVSANEIKRVMKSHGYRMS